MPWEQRRRGGRYYTRSRKVDGRVVREYVGGGVVGEFAAEIDLRKRRERKIEAAERAHIAELDASLAELCQVVDVLVHGVLLMAGYRQYHRGEWRRRRAGDATGAEDATAD